MHWYKANFLPFFKAWLWLLYLIIKGEKQPLLRISFFFPNFRGKTSSFRRNTGLVHGASLNTARRSSFTHTHTHKRARTYRQTDGAPNTTDSETKAERKERSGKNEEDEAGGGGGKERKPTKKQQGGKQRGEHNKRKLEQESVQLRSFLTRVDARFVGLDSKCFGDAQAGDISFPAHNTWSKVRLQDTRYLKMKISMRV